MLKRSDWTREKLEDFISRMTGVTVPVNTRLEGQQRVMDLSEVESILREAKVTALGDCYCRKEMKRCDAPVDVCVSIDGRAQSNVERGFAKRASLRQALEALTRTHEAGLVHLAFMFKDDGKIGYVCSCCSCCCHSLSAMIRFGMPGATVASRYIATNNVTTCTNCGICVDRCQFKARRLEDGRLVYDQTRCFGCGVCVSKCPTGSIVLVERRKRKS